MYGLATLWLCCFSVTAASDLPRHFIGASEPLTAPSAGPPRAIARDFTRNLALSHGLATSDLEGLYVFKEYRTAHNGVTHLVFRQQFHGLDVYNAEWTVNVDRDGSVLNAGGALAQQPAAGPPALGSAPPALRAARAAVRPAIGPEPAGQAVWFRVNGVLRPAWVFNVMGENGIDCYATVVDAGTRQVLAQTNLTLYQAPPRGLVFERQSPQPNPTPGVLLTAPPPYVERTVQSFAGDPLASPRGWVSGAATVGNNVVATHNPLGVSFLEGGLPAVSPALDFAFPLELGPGAPNPIRFRDAATANLFYWANRAHDLFYQYGFDEAAGNFQQDNFGRGGAGGDPMRAYSQFGAAANTSASLNNAFFSSSRYEDGSRTSINMYLGASAQEGVFSDTSYDAQSILHEYTHGLSSRLVRQAYDHHQGGAMGEGWSDFFALEFTVPEGAPPDGAYVRGEYAYRTFGAGIRTRPYSTNLEVNPVNFKMLGRVSSAPGVHADGEIWMEALWEMRAALIRQFGEREGRRRTRFLVVDGMKLSPPAPTMVDARDAILLADRAGFNGASQEQIWEAFARRGLGVLAHSASPDSIHILACYETPSPVGALRFYEDHYIIYETVRLVLHDANSSAPSIKVLLTTTSGDRETLALHRTGNLYWGSIDTWGGGSVVRGDAYLDVIPYDDITAYYVDPDAGGSWRLIEASVGVRPEHYAVITPNQAPRTSPDEQALFTLASGVRYSGLSTRRVLPFPFPFFGQHHAAVWVYGDGLLSLGAPRFAPCSDRASLLLVNGIAPMWMDLAYGGSAQRNENVYWSTGPGWVTIRWAAETQLSLGPYQRSEPVNFAATLWEDGRIQFFYGEGNKNLTNSSLLASARGCTASAPTVGISNGHETYSRISSYHDGRSDLEKAVTVTMEPPVGSAGNPVVKLESPAHDGHYQGLLAVSGIAYDDEWPVSRLDVLIDGVSRARAYVNTSRPDFCATQRVRGCPTVGFNAPLNLARLGIAPGRHSLRIRATNARGSFQDFPEQPVTFVVQAGDPPAASGALEAPSAGEELSGAVTVKGYAYSKDLRLLAVDVILDGVTYGPATYNQRRDDVCGPLDPKPPNCPNVGFTYNLDTRFGTVPLPNGRHTLQVRVRDEIDNLTLIPVTPLPITINNPANQAPQGVLSEPKPNQKLSGKVKISGYAWDPDGKVTAVTLLIDGGITFPLRYGVGRPDECANLPEVAACPNIGFEGELDTTQFPNGPHVLGIRLTDDGRSTTTIPRLARYGMNVFIEN